MLGCWIPGGRCERGWLPKNGKEQKSRQMREPTLATIVSLNQVVTLYNRGRYILGGFGFG